MVAHNFQRVSHALRQLGFYWTRLRRERLTRSFGVALLVFGVLIQAAAVFLPGPAARATSTDPNDNIIFQGAANKAALLAVYDQNRDAAGHTDIQAIYARIGVTRADLMNATEGTYFTDDFGGTLSTLGRLNWNVSNRSLLDVPGASTTIFTGGFLQNANHIHFPERALIGHRAIDGQWFAITLDCGNVVFVVLPPVVKNITVCRPGTGVITIKETDRQAGDVAADSPLCQPSVVACNALTVTPIARTSNGDVTAATFTASTTEQNATLNSVTFVVRDSQGNEVSRTTNNQVKITTPGTFTVQAIATFNVKGETKTVTSNECQAQFVVPAENQITVCRPGTGVITIPESQKRSGDLAATDQACQPKPPVTTVTPTPPAPTELPHTGPADTFLGALGIALLAGATYYYWDSRRVLAGQTA